MLEGDFLGRALGWDTEGQGGGGADSSTRSHTSACVVLDLISSNRRTQMLTHTPLRTLSYF